MLCVLSGCHPPHRSAHPAVIMRGTHMVSHTSQSVAGALDVSCLASHHHEIQCTCPVCQSRVQHVPQAGDISALPLSVAYCLILSQSLTGCCKLHASVSFILLNISAGMHP